MKMKYNYEKVENIKKIIDNTPTDMFVDHIEYCCKQNEQSPKHKGPCMRAWAHIRVNNKIIISEEYGCHFPELIKDVKIRWLMMSHRVSWQHMTKFNRAELEMLKDYSKKSNHILNQIEIVLSNRKRTV